MKKRKSTCGSPMTMVIKSKGPTCWGGYERVPGTKEFSKGSCRKK
tara:strand:+ start:144 stop:278 length:135 start_codon:yes stop_codon:yes gene_type:complete